MSEVKVNVDNLDLKLSVDEYRTVLIALRLYSSFLDEELRNVKATIADSDAEKVAETVLKTKQEALNRLNAKFNMVSVRLAGLKEKDPADKE